MPQSVSSQLTPQEQALSILDRFRRQRVEQQPALENAAAAGGARLGGFTGLGVGGYGGHRLGRALGVGSGGGKAGLVKKVLATGLGGLAGLFGGRGMGAAVGRAAAPALPSHYRSPASLTTAPALLDDLRNASVHQASDSDPLQYLAKTAGNLASFARGAMSMGRQAAPQPVASTAGPAGGGQPRAMARMPQSIPPQQPGFFQGLGRQMQSGMQNLGQQFQQGMQGFGQQAQGLMSGMTGGLLGGQQAPVGGVMKQMAPQQQQAPSGTAMSGFGRMIGMAGRMGANALGRAAGQAAPPQAQSQSLLGNPMAGMQQAQSEAQPQAQPPQSFLGAPSSMQRGLTNFMGGQTLERGSAAPMGGQTLERTAADLYALGGVVRPEKKGGAAAGSCPFAGAAASTASSEKTAGFGTYLRQGANYLRQSRPAQAVGNFARSMVRPAERGAANNLRNMTAWQHARQLPMMAGGAMLGNMTGEDLGLPGSFEGPGGFRVNPLGALTGMAMGHRGVRSTRFGQTMLRPAMQAGAGSLTGSIADTGAGLAGVDTHGMGGRLGAWAGLGMGFGGNRVLNRRDAINNAIRRRLAAVGGDAGLRQGVINAGRQQMGQLMNSPMHRANQFLNQALEGSIDPFRGAWRRARGWFTGQAAPSAASRAAPGVQTAGRRVGQLATAVPLGMTAAGLGYNALTGRLRDDANQQFAQMYGAGREQMMSDLDDYMHARGMLDQQGHFNPMQGAGHQLMQAANPFLQMLGFHNPQQMSGGQRLAGMTGPAMAGMGLMSGNPMLTGLGAGMYAYPHLTQGRGQAPQPHPLTAMVPGAPGFTGLDRNEFTHQSRHSAAQPSGQGWL